MSRPADESRPMEAKALARARSEALRVRTRRIRRSVAGLAVTLFVLVFAVVYVQLASGHDPALVANARRRAASAQGTSAATRTSSSSGAAEAASGGEATGTTESTTDSEATTSGESSSSSGEESSSPSAVTTSQS